MSVSLDELVQRLRARNSRYYQPPPETAPDLREFERQITGSAQPPSTPPEFEGSFFQNPIERLGRGLEFARQDIAQHFGKPFPEAATGIAGALINRGLDVMSFPSREISPYIVGAPAQLFGDVSPGETVPETGRRIRKRFGEFYRAPDFDIPIPFVNEGFFEVRLGTVPAEFAFDVLTDPTTLLAGLGIASKAAKLPGIAKAFEIASLVPSYPITKPIEAFGAGLKALGITKLTKQGELQQAINGYSRAIYELGLEDPNNVLPNLRSVSQPGIGVISDQTREILSQPHLAPILTKWERKLSQTTQTPEQWDTTAQQILSDIQRAERKNLGITAKEGGLLGNVNTVLKQGWLGLNPAFPLANAVSAAANTVARGHIALSDVTERLGLAESAAERVMGLQGFTGTQLRREGPIPLLNAVSKPILSFNEKIEKGFRSLVYQGKTKGRFDDLRDGWLTKAYNELVDAGANPRDASQIIDGLRSEYFNGASFANRVRPLATPPPPPGIPPSAVTPKPSPPPPPGISPSAVTPSPSPITPTTPTTGAAPASFIVRFPSDPPPGHAGVISAFKDRLSQAKTIGEVNQAVAEAKTAIQAEAEAAKKAVIDLDVPWANREFGLKTQTITDVMHDHPDHVAGIATLGLLDQMAYLRSEASKIARQRWNAGIQHAWSDYAVIIRSMSEMADNALAALTKDAPREYGEGFRPLLDDLKESFRKMDKGFDDLNSQYDSQLQAAAVSDPSGRARAALLNQRDLDFKTLANSALTDFWTRNRNYYAEYANWRAIVETGPIRDFTEALKSLIYAKADVPRREAFAQSIDRTAAETQQWLDGRVQQTISGGALGRAAGARRSTAVSPSNPKLIYEFDYEVVPLNSLRTSDQPGFPKELQTRMRDRAASQQQIDQLARDLNPDLLLYPTELDNGPPIIDAANNVISGNGRVMAIRRAHTMPNNPVVTYHNEVLNRMDEFGVERPALITSADNLVLVRRVVGDPDLVKLAEDSNARRTLGMSVIEEGINDATKLNIADISHVDVPASMTLDQALASPANRDFVLQWSSGIPANEQATIMDAAGNLSVSGIHRLKSAIFAKVFPGPAGVRILRLFFESSDDVINRAEYGVMQSLPDLAKLKQPALASYDLTDDLAAAVDKMARLSGKMTVGQYLQQGAMFGRDLTPDQEQLLVAIAALAGGRLGSGRRLGDFLKRYVEVASDVPPLEQGALPGMQVARPTRASLLNRTLSEVEQGPLFAETLRPAESIVPPPTARAATQRVSAKQREARERALYEADSAAFVKAAGTQGQGVPISPAQIRPSSVTPQLPTAPVEPLPSYPSPMVRPLGYQPGLPGETTAPIRPPTPPAAPVEPLPPLPPPMTRPLGMQPELPGGAPPRPPQPPAPPAPPSKPWQPPLSYSKINAKIDELARDLQIQIGKIDDEAVQHVGEIHYNYWPTNLDAFLGFFSPFTVWQTRNIPFWINELARRPHLARFVDEYMQRSDKELEERGLTERLRGTVRVGRVGETELRSNLLAPVITGVAQAVHPFIFTGDEEGVGAQGTTPFGAALQTLLRFSGGLTLYPYIGVPLQMLGAFGETPYTDIQPISRGIRGVNEITGVGLPDVERDFLQKLLRGGGELAASANIPGVPGLRQTSFTGDIFRDEQIRRRISEIGRKSGADVVDMLRAMNDPQSELWKKAQREVDREEDIRGFARLFIPANVKTLSMGEAQLREAKARLPQYNRDRESEDFKLRNQMLKADPGLSAYLDRFDHPAAREITAEINEYYSLGDQAARDRVDATPSEKRKALYQSDPKSAEISKLRQAYLREHPALDSYFERDHDKYPTMREYVASIVSQPAVQAKVKEAVGKAGREQSPGVVRAQAEIKAVEEAGKPTGVKAQLDNLLQQYDEMKVPRYDEYFELKSGAERTAWRNNNPGIYQPILQSAEHRHEFVLANDLLAQWWAFRNSKGWDETTNDQFLKALAEDRLLTPAQARQYIKEERESRRAGYEARQTRNEREQHRVEPVLARGIRR